MGLPPKLLVTKILVTTSLVPSTWYQGHGTKYLGDKKLVADTLYQVLGTKHFVLDAWCTSHQILGGELVPDTWRQVLGTKYVMLGCQLIHDKRVHLNAPCMTCDDQRSDMHVQDKTPSHDTYYTLILITLKHIPYCLLSPAAMHSPSWAEVLSGITDIMPVFTGSTCAAWEVQLLTTTLGNQQATNVQCVKQAT